MLDLDEISASLGDDVGKVGDEELGGLGVADGGAEFAECLGIGRVFALREPGDDGVMESSGVGEGGVRSVGLAEL